MALVCVPIAFAAPALELLPLAAALPSLAILAFRLGPSARDGRSTLLAAAASGVSLFLMGVKSIG